MAADNNSYARSDTPKRPSFEERKKDMTQYIGVGQAGQRKENAWWTWFKDMFFSGRSLKDIAKEVATEQIAPQIKDNVRNSLVTMLDMGIYKDHRTTGTSSGTPSSFITNYVTYGNKQQTNVTTSTSKLEQHEREKEAVLKSGFESPKFPTRKAADDFLRDMKAYVTKYTTMSVLDLAWMQGERIDYTWDVYGWEAKDILAIERPVHINDPEKPWAIFLPKAGELS